MYLGLWLLSFIAKSACWTPFHLQDCLSFCFMCFFLLPRKKFIMIENVSEAASDVVTAETDRETESSVGRPQIKMPLSQMLMSLIGDSEGMWLIDIHWCGIYLLLSIYFFFKPEKSFKDEDFLLLERIMCLCVDSFHLALTPTMSSLLKVWHVLFLYSVCSSKALTQPMNT